MDLPCIPPLITITCNLSEVESDVDSISPAVKPSTHLNTQTGGGMTYLSPFSMGSRGDHTASESNLSSSGYSSMASPGPSRCGSSNPLCPSETEDPGPPGPNSNNRPSSVLKSSSNPTEASSSKLQQDCSRGRSDSETLSDDPLLESNDEGIGTDHIEEKIEEGEVKSAKELETYIREDSLKCLDVMVPEVKDHLLIPPKKSLQLPSITIQCDSSDKHLSPVSSRSESPLSDRTTGIGRFSPQFYGGNKESLPFTDSDGLYDFPSSDKVNVTTNAHQHKKLIGRKREKKSSRKSLSPTKTNHLDIPCKDSYFKMSSPRKPSPKRRSRSQKLVSSSSSSDSVTSTKEAKMCSSSPSPDTVRWSTSLEWTDGNKVKSPEASAEETGDVSLFNLFFHKNFNFNLHVLLDV